MFGKRRVIIASLVVFATAPLLYLPVTESWQLMAVRFYHGFATAIFGTVATAAIAERYPDRRAAMLSRYSSITIVGRSIAPFLGGFLISTASFHSVFVACAVSGVIAWLAGSMLPREQRARSDEKAAFPQFFSALRTVLQNRTIVLTSLVEAGQYLVYGAIEAFLALYAASIGIPAWQVGIILGVQLVSVVAIKPVMGVLSDRFGRQAVILPGLLLGTISVALLPLGADVFMLSLLSLLFGIAFATVTSSTSALVADLSEARAVRRFDRRAANHHGCRANIGPVLTGFVVGVWGYGIAFPVLAAVLALSAVLFVFAPKTALAA